MFVLDDCREPKTLHLSFSISSIECRILPHFHARKSPITIKGAYLERKVGHKYTNTKDGSSPTDVLGTSSLFRGLPDVMCVIFLEMFSYRISDRSTTDTAIQYTDAKPAAMDGSPVTRQLVPWTWCLVHYPATSAPAFLRLTLRLLNKL